MCFGSYREAKKLSCLFFPFFPPNIIPRFSFALSFLAQNKGLQEWSLFAASWLGPKSDATERNLTNRPALARSPAKLRRLDTLVEVLSTLSHWTQTLPSSPASPSWALRFSSSFPAPSTFPSLFESASVTCSSQSPGSLILAKTRFSGTKGTQVQG